VNLTIYEFNIKTHFPSDENKIITLFNYFDIKNEFIQINQFDNITRITSFNETFSFMDKLLFDDKYLDIIGGYKKIFRKRNYFLCVSSKFNIYRFIKPLILEQDDNCNELLIKYINDFLLKVNMDLKFKVDLFIEYSEEYIYDNKKYFLIKGEFATDLFLPNYLGLGKFSEYGYGIIKQIDIEGVK